MRNESQFGFQRPLKAPLLPLTLCPRGSLSGTCTFSIARGMVCTAAFVLVLVIILLGI